jgi:hypothetical protein
MSIQYKEEQYRKIIPAALEFWARCRNQGLTGQGLVGNYKVAITYCPTNHTYHLYDINRKLLIVFRKLRDIDVPKNTTYKELINNNIYEWNVSTNAYKEGISTVILMYDSHVQGLVNHKTTWDITELRKIMSKNFQYPIIQFN